MSKKDEIKAKREAKELQQKYDDLKNASNKKVSNARNACRE